MCLKEKLQSPFTLPSFGEKSIFEVYVRKKVVYRDKENRLRSAINSVHVFWSRPTYASTQELFLVKMKSLFVFQKVNLRLNGRGCFSFSNIDLFLILSRLPIFFFKKALKSMWNSLNQRLGIRHGLRKKNGYKILHFFGNTYQQKQTV